MDTDVCYCQSAVSLAPCLGLSIMYSHHHMTVKDCTLYEELPYLREKYGRSREFCR